MNKIRNRLLHWTLLLVFCSLSFSCATSTKVTYLQDIHPNATMKLQEAKDLRLQPGDKLSVIVHSRDLEVAQMFNLVNNNRNLQTNPTTGSEDYSLYTVDNEGNIDMPILGLIKAQGLTRIELSNLIKYKLLSGNLLRDPVVTVEYANLSFYVAGEVNDPGRKMIDRDRITLLEALSQAGDLTIQGKRNNILVLRTENGVQTPYRVDLTETNSLYSSPAFYLQQNDYIYVEPTTVKANESKLNANTTRTPSFWISVASFLMTVAVLFTN